MTTTTATYRKTKTGQWVVYAPAATLRAGSIVTVTKANGTTKSELIQSVGRSFEVGGRMMAYGYLTTTVRTIGASRPTGRSCRTGGNCSSFGRGRSCGGHDCDGY